MKPKNRKYYLKESFIEDLKIQQNEEAKLLLSVEELESYLENLDQRVAEFEKRDDYTSRSVDELKKNLGIKSNVRN
ncbi:MAG: hypothetical protein ACMXYB_02970 [Candidatus Woesearchaeota archaeon]